jgi:hypothetical protein
VIDKLEHLIRLQRDLQTRTFGFDFATMTPDERIRYIRDQHQAIVVELVEALDEVEWKPWAQPVSPAHGRRINRDAFVGELIDVLHFWVNMVLAVSGDATPTEVADEVFTRYALKHRVNVQRQADGYDGSSTKCHSCKRALDDPAVACWRRGDQGFCSQENVDVNYVKS